VTADTASFAPMTSAVRRGAVVLLVLALAATGIYFGARFLWSALQGRTEADSCRVGSYEIDPDQAAVGSTMVGVVLQRGLPERAAVLTLAAGLQESKLRNLPAGSGDRDSVGVLQQRPSQGWGTEAQLSDVHFATGAFLDALVKVENWQTRPLTEAVQAVQISAVPEGYARHEPEAQALADALTGKNPAGISCSFGTPTQVATPLAVATSVTDDLPVTNPTTADGAVSVPGASWATAAWFVANAERLGIDQVAYAQRTWTRQKGWRTSAAPTDAVVATLHRS
jgi:hypothetical protein